MHEVCFPNDEWVDKDHEHWVAWDEDKPVGFCSLKVIEKEKTVFLSRAGVIPKYQGNNLQRRFLLVREQWTKKRGIKSIITYCTKENYGSLVNLLKSGYRIYDPQYAWVGRDVFYFTKELKHD
jgi:GNAT superfamily N-acetyltransferase